MLFFILRKKEINMIFEVITNITGKDNKKFMLNFQTKSTYERYGRKEIDGDLFVRLESTEENVPSKLFYFDDEKSKQIWIETNLRELKKFPVNKN